MRLLCRLTIDARLLDHNNVYLIRISSSLWLGFGYESFGGSALVLIYCIFILVFNFGLRVQSLVLVLMCLVYRADRNVFARY